jgi:hypothetical protein
MFLWEFNRQVPEYFTGMVSAARRYASIAKCIAREISQFIFSNFYEFNMSVKFQEHLQNIGVK